MKINRRTFLKDSVRAVAGTVAAGAVGSAGGAMSVASAAAVVPSDVLGRAAPSNRIAVAMIGVGRQTASVNIPQVLESKNAQVVAVCDVDSWRLANAQKQVNDFYAKAKGTTYNGCAAFKDYREVLRRADIDAVMISTPDHWHIPMAIDAARAGKPISLEKPVGTSIDHGRRLVATLKKHPVITRNDSEFRTLPKFSRAVELVRNGRVGKLRRISVGVPPESNGPALPPIPTMPVPDELDYDFWLGPAWEAPYTENRVHPIKAYGRPGWMRVDAYCNGMISNWGAHLMGIAQWGNGTETTGPVSVEGSGVFDQGLWNTLNSFEIRYRYADGVELIFKIERPFVRFEGDTDWVEIEYPDKLTASRLTILESEIGPGEIRIRDLPSDKEDFLLAVKSGKPSLEPLETAHRTITMCQLGLIAIKTGSKLTWNPETEEIVGDNAASAMLSLPIREKYFHW